jgi:hypothetical protein
MPATGKGVGPMHPEMVPYVPAVFDQAQRWHNQDLLST